MRLNFIKDSLYNADSNILDENGIQTSENYRICHKLNQSSGYVNFKSGGSRDFYCVPDQNNTVPEQIYVKASFLSGFQHNLDFNLSINNTSVYNTTFNTSGPYELVDGQYQVSKSGYFTPNQIQLDNLLRNKNSNKSTIRHDIVKINVNSSNPASGLDQRLRNLEIDYSGQKYSSYNSLTPETQTFYPSTLSGFSVINSSGTNPSDASFVSGPTNSSGGDATWIYNQSHTSQTESGYLYNISYLDFYFNTSGLFNQNNNTRNIDKCVFSIRANNSSGNISNNQEWSYLQLFANEFDNAIGFGSGFHINNKGGFTKLESNIAFIKDGRPNNKFSTSDLVDNFFIRLYQPPKNTKISRVQTDLYLSNDDMFCMSVRGDVNYKRENIRPSGVYSFNTGKNRLKENIYDEGFFNVVYRPVNSGDSYNGNHSNNWNTYYNQQIPTYEYHNHDYKNYTFLNNEQYLQESFNSSNNYTILLHCSTAGFSNYLESQEGAVLLEKYNGHSPEFKIIVHNNELECLTFHTDGGITSSFFNSYPNTLLLLTKRNNGGYDDFNVFISSSDSNFEKVFSNGFNKIISGNGGLFIGGSGIGNFSGYIHEYGISSVFLDDEDIPDYENTRFNISKTICDNKVLELTVSNLEEKLIDEFSFNLQKMNSKERFFENNVTSFAYNSLITNSNSCVVNCNYELYSNNPSGIKVSGFYQDLFSRNSDPNNGAFNLINFSGHLPNGSGNVSLTSYTHPNEIINGVADFLYSPYINLKLESQDNYGNYYNLKIKDIFLSFDGWYTNQTGILPISFITNGYTYEDESIDFYLHNASAASGVDFYLKGKEVSNNYINFHTNASIIQQSGVTFNTIGGQVAFNGLDFYSAGPILTIGEISLFIEGNSGELSDGSIGMFLPSMFNDGVGIGWDNVYYNDYGYPYYYGDAGYGIYSSVGFNSYSDFNPQGSINLYISTSEEESEDSINFSIEGESLSDSHFNMFLPNNQSNSRYQLDFFLPSAYNQSGNINMFIEGD